MLRFFVNCGSRQTGFILSRHSITRYSKSLPAWSMQFLSLLIHENLRENYPLPSMSKAGFSQVPAPFQSIQGMNVGLKEGFLSQLWLQHRPRDAFVQGCCAKVWSGNATALTKTVLAPHALGGSEVNAANLLWMLFHRTQKCHWSPCIECMQGVHAKNSFWLLWEKA